ncbi:transposase DNA-binding-containing protein [Nostoc sp. NMS9]|nr:hypothetical protein [Nostoc sp. NMS9]
MELGDKRRTKRLIKIVENLSAKPEASPLCSHSSPTLSSYSTTDPR